MPLKLVKIRHKETQAVGTCPEGALETWLARGYERVDDDTPTTDPVSTAAAGFGTFDPSAVSAKEVNTYLTGLDTSTDAGQAEYDRVVQLETDGQNRSTAVPA